jgi:hypothetical protein
VLPPGARRPHDLTALRLIVASFIVFHASTALLELDELWGRVDVVLLANVLARVVISAASWFCLRKRERTV